MQVLMLKDVEKVGMVGQSVKVSTGYAVNYLIPKKLAMKLGKNEVVLHQVKVETQKVEKQTLNSKAAMLAERIKSIHITIKERVHDDGKLYGSVGASEIVDLMKEKDIHINKKQVEFDKSIRAVGEHKVTIKLSSKLKPQLTLKVVDKNK